MPYPRPALSALKTQVAQDISSQLPGTGPLLRFSNLNIVGVAQAMLAHGHYGYLDWIAQQSNPFTATDEYLEAWAALKGITRNPATQATGAVIFLGVVGTVVPAGVKVVRSDGVAYVTTTSGTVATRSGTGTPPPPAAIVQAQAVADPTGLTGAFGNCSAGTALTLGTVIAGLNSSGNAYSDFTGGTDIETDDSLRARMQFAYRNPAHGGSQADYIGWALSVPGVTRAWCVPNGYGAGTVLVYVMFDAVEVAYGGFPQGTNGVAALEPRAAAATGDQLAVANYIFSQAPVTALIYVLAPTASPVNFTISGVPSGARAAVSAAIASTLAAYGSVGAGATSVALNLIEAAISAVAGTTGFVITTPAGNISTAAGAIPTLGTITWT